MNPASVPADHHAEPTAGRRSGRSSRRVLHVEDDNDYATLVARKLDMPGLELRHVTTGADGIAAAAGWRPHLIVLDLDLPDSDGITVLRRLRATPEHQRIRIVVLSSAAASDRPAALEAGADEVHDKLGGLNVLVDAVAAPHQGQRPATGESRASSRTSS